MKFLIKEKIFTFADKFNIEDENGNSKYEVVGEIFTFGNKLRLYDMNGREIIYIEQKLFRFLPEYEIYKSGSIIGRIKKEFTFFVPSFQIDSDYGNLTIEGDIFQHEFNILRNGQIIASISKKWVSWSDTYSIDILEGEDEAFLLSIVITLDQIYYDGNNNNG
ncbi:MAG: hypothetical protein GX968_05860 [Tissierellia bacterium]|nr:hypothetical protein [Tissierellia bacterium]